MITLTLLHDHDPVRVVDFEDEDFEEANEKIKLWECLPNPYWVDVDIEDAETVRECSICGKLHDEGYYCQGTGRYYCSDGCLHEDYTQEEYEAQYSDDDPDCCFYTTWYD